MSVTPDMVYQVPFDRAVQGERTEQVDRHGYDTQHDDEHEPSEWGLLVLRYAGRLGEQLEKCLFGAFEDDGWEWLLEVKASVVELGAVCAALSDTLDRKIAADEAKSDGD